MIYYGKYGKTVIDDQYIIMPARWRQPEIVDYNLIKTKEGFQFLYCSENKDAFLLTEEYGSALTKGHLNILNERKIFLPEGFLKYMEKRNLGNKVACYGNIDHFEIWLPKELKHVEDNIDFEEMEKELRDLGLDLD